MCLTCGAPLFIISKKATQKVWPYTSKKLILLILLLHFLLLKHELRHLKRELQRGGRFCDDVLHGDDVLHDV